MPLKPNYHFPVSTMIDLDRDARPDILDCFGVSPGPDFDCKFHRNTGSGFEPAVSWTVPQSAEELEFSHALRAIVDDDVDKSTIKELIDINGDGLPDLVSSASVQSTGHWDVWLNTGQGFTDHILWNAPSYNVQNRQNASPCCVSTGTLADMNGDGLRDYVVGAAGGLFVHFNTGHGFAETGQSWEGSAGLPYLPYVEASFAEGYTSRVGVHLLDVNGDNLADYLERTTDGTIMTVRFNAGRPSDLLTKQTNGLGASWIVTYGLSNEPEDVKQCQSGPNQGLLCSNNADCPGSSCTVGCTTCSRPPSPIWVANELVVDSGMSGPGAIMTTDWSFLGGYFDKTARQFRGFRRSTEVRVADNQRTERLYAPPPYKPSESLAWPYSAWIPGEVPSEPFELVYQRVSDSSGSASVTDLRDWETVATPDGRAQSRVGLTRRTHVSSPSGVDRQTLQRVLQYDTYLNVISSTVTGATTVGGSTTPDFSPITTETDYFANGFCPGREQEVRVVDTSTGAVLSRTIYTYSLLRCNLETVQQILAPHGVSAATGEVVTTLNVYYDNAVEPVAAAGLPTRLTDALGHATTLSYNIDGDYSCGGGIAPCVVTNAKDHATTFQYDLQWLKPSQVVEPNGATSTFVHDGLGRPLSELRSGDLGTCGGTTCFWRKYDYSFGEPGLPSRVDTLFPEPNQSSTGYRTVHSFIDSLGRPLGRKERRLIGAVGALVNTDSVAFDEVGRIERRFVPYVSATQNNAYEAPPVDTPASVAQYDGLDRPQAIVHPDGTFRTMDYSVAGRVTTYDENYNECFPIPSGVPASCPGAKVVEFRDALGRVTRVDAYEGPALLITTTSNAYDALGRVVVTVISGDLANGGTGIAASTFEYDSLSRRTAMDDPDSGRWSYEYDNRGKLIFQNDPKSSQSIAFCHDEIGRLVRKAYLAGDTSAGVDREELCDTGNMLGFRHSDFSYDTDSVGRLHSVLDRHPGAAGEPPFTLTTSFNRDVRGRVVREEWIRSIEVGGELKTRTTDLTFVWDAADRLTVARYPATGTTVQDVTTTYSGTGQITAVVAPGQTFAGSLLYDRFGRTIEWRDGSGLRHRADYAAAGNFRLQRMRVYGTTGGLSDMELAYNTYDAVGNIQFIEDLSAYEGNPATLRSTRRYVYDGLGRLESEQLGDGPIESFAYDGIGNMRSGHGMSFEYGTAAYPHRIMSVEQEVSQPTEHDDNGALTAIPVSDEAPDRQIDYDADGMVSLVTANGGVQTVRSVYDFRGQRVARITDEGLPSESVTFYFGRWFEVTEGVLTRHLYLGNLPIADSPIPAPDHLTLAAAAPGERAVALARVMRSALAENPELYPEVFVTSTAAAAGGFVLVVTFAGLTILPWKVRAGYLGKVHRGRIAIVVLVFAFSLSPLKVRPAKACCGGGDPPPTPSFPVFFRVHDHLGSTLALTCHKMSNCADREVFRYYRYTAYGKTTEYDQLGAAISGDPSWNQPPTIDGLYTGQTWDWAAHLYHYGARAYDPTLARFVTMDPVREFYNPYAYVGWQPNGYVDPTGRQLDAGWAVTAVTIGAIALPMGFVSARAALTGVAVTFAAIEAAQAPDATAGSVLLSTSTALAWSIVPLGGGRLKTAGPGLLGLLSGVSAAFGEVVGQVVPAYLTGRSLDAADVAVDAAAALAGGGFGGAGGIRFFRGTGLVASNAQAAEIGAAVGGLFLSAQKLASPSYGGVFGFAGGDLAGLVETGVAAAAAASAVGGGGTGGGSGYAGGPGEGTGNPGGGGSEGADGGGYWVMKEIEEPPAPPPPPGQIVIPIPGLN